MKFKKLRRAYRVFFPKQISDKTRLEQRLQNNNEIAQLEQQDNLYKATLKNNIQLYLRGVGSSDHQVLEQIFNFKEYQLVLSLLRLNTSVDNNKIIIDAGANVGYTSLYFAHHLSNAQIFAVEPSDDNLNVLKKNFAISENANSMTVYGKALSHKKGLSFDLNRDFRDGKDWAITTNEVDNGFVKGITIGEIVENNKLDYISFLKIDIEGAERFIFNPENDLSFLSITEIIAIEIHDEYDVRESIELLLKQHHFMLMESGELTIGINTQLLQRE